MFSFFKVNKLSSTESVDIIEEIVYKNLKSLGFRKYGRTLHRYVEGDISQVINFQNGCPAKGVFGILWVNLGIRVPECVERRFVIEEQLKKYYNEYECNIRSRLGFVVDGKDTFYDLKKNPNEIGDDITKRIRKHVLPVFDVLNSRDAILNHRSEYVRFDQTKHLILLEDSMILGRKGDISQASLLFNKYYRTILEEYNHDLEFGIKRYLHKGEKITYLNTKTNKTETVIETKSGYAITYNASRVHLSYLEELANELGLEILK